MLRTATEDPVRVATTATGVPEGNRDLSELVSARENQARVNLLG